MRVLHVTQPTDGGVARVALDLVADQAAAGWQVTLASPPTGAVREAVVAVGAQHLTWPAVRTPGPATVGETRTLRQLVLRAAPQLVHLHSSKAGLAGRLALRGTLPTVFQPHCWSFEVADGALAAVAGGWERLAQRWTHACVCVSRSEREAGHRRGVHDRMYVIPNGVDLTDHPAATETDRAVARERLRLTGPVAVFVGRLAPQKGADLLLDAWPLVLGAVPDAQLVVVGDGPDGRRLRARATPRTRFVGHQDDVRPWLAAADVVVIPSRWEAMALVVLEAMASARPVVATDVGGARECVEPGGGAVVPLSDATALAEATIRRLRDPDLAVREGRWGRAQVERAHDLRVTATRIRSLYEDVLDAAHHHR